MEANKDTRFKPGQSGNPAGRPRGSGLAGQARLELVKAWDGEGEDGKGGIRHKLIEQAKAGDMLAIKLVAERVCPALKPTDASGEIELEGATLADKAMSVIVALGSGEVPMAQAAQLLAGLGTLAKIVETEELKQRIEALERALKEAGHGRV